jgi:hypothetical protein
MFLLLCSLLSKLDVEVAAAKLEEDGLCGHHPSGLGGAFIEKLLGGMLVKKLLAKSSLLLLTSGFLVKKALAGCHLVALVVVLPQFVHSPLPGLVSLFCMGRTPGKNWSSPLQWWQKPRSLVVFTPGTIQPILIAMGTNVPSERACNL